MGDLHRDRRIQVCYRYSQFFNTLETISLFFNSTSRCINSATNDFFPKDFGFVMEGLRTTGFVVSVVVTAVDGIVVSGFFVVSVTTSADGVDGTDAFVVSIIVVAGFVEVVVSDDVTTGGSGVTAGTTGLAH